MTGEMTLEEGTRQKLSEAQGPVQYSDLRAHLERGSVFVVATSISLVECGVKVALDEVDVVKAWLDSGELRRPSAQEHTDWAQAENRTWQSLIVQPYVLVQD